MSAEYIWFKGGHPSRHTQDESGERPTRLFFGGGVGIQYWYGLNGVITLKEYTKHGKKHRDGDKPALISYHRSNGNVSHKSYYKHGKKHRDGDKPALISYHHPNGNVSYKSYYKNGKEHRDGDKPAYVCYDTNGNVSIESYYKNGNLYYPPTT